MTKTIDTALENTGFTLPDFSGFTACIRAAVAQLDCDGVDKHSGTVDNFMLYYQRVMIDRTIQGMIWATENAARNRAMDLAKLAASDEAFRYTENEGDNHDSNYYRARAALNEALVGMFKEQVNQLKALFHEAVGETWAPYQKKEKTERRRLSAAATADAAAALGIDNKAATEKAKTQKAHDEAHAGPQIGTGLSDVKEQRFPHRQRAKG